MNRKYREYLEHAGTLIEQRACGCRVYQIDGRQETVVCGDPLKHAYAADVGREPPDLPDDHPDRWQWEYAGTPNERRNLLDRLQECADRDAPPTQDETLF